VLGKHHHFIKLERRRQIKATVTSVDDLPPPVTAKTGSNHKNTVGLLDLCRGGSSRRYHQPLPRSLALLASQLGNSWHKKNHPLTINSTAPFKRTLMVTILGQYPVLSVPSDEWCCRQCTLCQFEGGRICREPSGGQATACRAALGAQLPLQPACCSTADGCRAQ